MYEFVMMVVMVVDLNSCHYAKILMTILRLLAEGCTFDTVATGVDPRSKSIIDNYIDGM